MFDPTNVCDNRAAAGARPLVNALSAVPRSSPGYPVFPLFSGRFFRRFRECRIGGDKVTARGSVRLNIGKIIAELVDCGITTVVVNALCAKIAETTLKFLIKLEGLENFDVRSWKKSR